MARPAPRGGAASIKQAPEENNDVCPVCKSSRYLNPNMRFLVNPECYHKMCESCVDRIYSHGPAPCPIAGCRRTLRKARFRKQTFEDIHVEREVDVRRRVAAVFNRREDEFESLHAYNDYLNEVEDLTFNLVQRVDVEATEQRLRAYAEANRAAIAENAGRASRENLTGEARRAAEREHARVRREEARREEEEERKVREEGRVEVLNRLASGGVGEDAEEIVRKEAQRVTLKKTSLRRIAAGGTAAGTAAASASARQADLDAAAGNGGPGNGGFQFKGLKKKVAPVAEKRYDPFDGLSDRKSYFTLQDDYEWDWLDRAKNDIRHTAGGYDFMSYYSRALCDAFSGFGVFVADEVAERDGLAMPAGEAAATATAGAADVAKKAKAAVDSDDVF